MSAYFKGKLNYRCPVCFMRDIDMDLFYDREHEEYHCLRCGYRGCERDINEMYDVARRRYRALRLRVNTFGEDNEQPTFSLYRGEDDNVSRR